MPDPLPRIRDDLKITPIDEGGQKSYIIEDPLRNTYYKIGLREYRFLCRLSQLKNQAEPYPEDGLPAIDISEEEALSILQWLAAKQLLQNQSQETMKTIEAADLQSRQKGLLNRLNLIIFRLPLFNPDPLLDRFLPWISWLAGPMFFILWLILGALAVAVFLTNWSRFISESSGFFSPTNVVIVFLIWVVLKLLHELSHALACKRYGGGVYDFGILFILFIPLTYVNASTSWGFATKWQRLHVAVAGIYIELFVAWCATLYWVTHTGTPGGLIAHNTVLVAGVSSLLFNANPLMRFDGYFILSDLTSIPNLYFRGLNYVRHAARKWWLGLDKDSQLNEYSLFVKIYGFGVYCWRLLVLLTLSFIASRMLSGWGMILAAIAIITWFYQPIHKFFLKFSDYQSENPRVVSHLVTRFIILAIFTGFVLFGVTWNKTLSVPAVVLFEKQHIIRAEASGFVQDIFVKPGDYVQQGDQLMLLVNEDLQSDRKLLELELKKIELQKRMAHVQDKYNELQILEERQKIITSQKHNLDADAQNLVLRTPGNGKIVGRTIGNRHGTLVYKGEPLCLVVDPEHKHLVASVDQNDIAAIQKLFPGDVVIDMSEAGLGTFTGQIKKIVPKASRNLVHFSFAAPFGGSFDVKPGEGGNYQLFSPRFNVHIAIPESVRPTLRDGQQAVIRVDGISQSPAQLIWKHGKSWFLERQGIN